MIFYFLFFFKQKTAYEMRISDWSSDVCSSDLRLPAYRWMYIAPIPLYLSRYCGLSAHRYKVCARGHVVQPELVGTIHHPVLRGYPAVQIGRASCRERVCQYV